MSVSIQVIRELHAWYLNLEDIQLQFDRGSKQILAYQQQDQDTRVALDKAQQDHNQLRLEGEQKELGLQIGEKKIEDLKGRLNQVKTNREYQVICDQIEVEKKSNNDLEDEILEAHTRIEEHSKHVVDLAGEVNSVQKDLEERKRSAVGERCRSRFAVQCKRYLPSFGRCTGSRWDGTGRKWNMQWLFHQYYSPNA